MSGLIGEISAFIAGLRDDLPELFRAPPPPPPRRATPRGTDRFTARCAFFAPVMGVEFGGVRLKEMSSLWGSCSSRGDLSFNRRLLEAPPGVLDYIVVHELAHLRWRGHGARFWDLVVRHCPDQRAHRRWLRTNGPALLRGELPGPAIPECEDAQVLSGLAGQGEVEAPGFGVGSAAV